jgi:soluble lytic murein transglycosylase-like protein
MKRPVLVLIALMSVPIQGHALTVPAAYHQVANEYDVPAGILFAIALTESGRKAADGQILPYPWAMNVNGKASYFANRAEAARRLTQLLGEGKQPDIGLMQVNWRYHRRKLGDVSQAFDPWLNLRAGATVLRDAYRATGDWWKAVGRYHSATPKRAKAYRARVLRWYARLG